MSASILIVEDEALIARDLELLLGDQGYHVVGIATTADEAVAMIRATPPDLVLLDIHLADGSDGIAVAEWLRSHASVPVIFVTAHADPKTVARAQAAGPYSFLLKPFHERQLQITVQLALARSAIDRQLRRS